MAEFVHWHGLEEQQVFEAAGVRQPTRCGLFEITATLGFPLENVTCPACRTLATIDANSTKPMAERPFLDELKYLADLRLQFQGVIGPVDNG